jgi:wobble nucleotide-excising tRNase
MIKKLLKIENVGRFDSYRPHGNVELTSFTFIFADNGRGKTTVCDILRSLQSGEGAYILGRKRLGTTGHPEVDILLTGATAKFRNGKWDVAYPNIAIFDSTFIHQNVFAGDYVDHDQKRNLYRVIVGEQGVILAKAVDESDGKIREATRDLAAKKQLLEVLLPPGIKLDDFIVLPPQLDIEKKIQDKEKELAEATATFNRSAEIKAKGLLKPVALPVFPAGFKELLAQTLETISKDAEAKIRQHITNHTSGATGEWLSKGLGYLKDDTCPLCGQDTNGLELITTYRSVFDATYQEFKNKLTAFKNALSTQFSTTTLVPVQKVQGDNAVLVEFWKQFLPITLPGGSLYDDGTMAANNVKTIADEILGKKVAAPLDVIACPPEFDTALATYSALSTTLTDYNGEVEKTNQRITQIKAQAQTVDPAKLKKELDGLKAVQRRLDAGTVKAVKDYLDATSLKSRLEEAKTKAKEQLDQYSDTVLKDCETRINQLLGMFGAGFRIGSTKRSYVGARVSSTYQIVINGQPVELGDSATPIQVASFRNTLSAGDKSTLALAFFIVQCERDPKIGQKTLAFDDPFNSQDRSRRSCTQEFLCKLAKSAKQVIVFSHDPYFLRNVWDEAPKDARRALQLSRMGSGTGTLLLEWDIENETRGEYAQTHRVLWRYFYEGIGDPRKVAQSIRPLLEKYLRMKLPNAFGDKEWLGDSIQKIRDASSTSPLDAGKIILSELGAINGYSKKYHHAQNANADTEQVDDGELQAFVKRTLDLVGGF